MRLTGTLHDLRHTFASHLAMEGVPIPIIQRLLEHSNIQTTMIYAHLSPDHDQVMPKKGKVLKPDEIALIELWIAEGAHWSERSIQVFPEAPLALDKPDLPDSPENHPIDQFIDQYFKKHQINWPKPVDDRKFIRRAYLDIIGLLPPPEDILAFSANQDKHKREKASIRQRVVQRMRKLFGKDSKKGQYEACSAFRDEIDEM